MSTYEFEEVGLKTIKLLTQPVPKQGSFVPFTAYQIEKLLDKPSHETVLKRLEDLRKNGSIKIVSKSKFRTGKTKKVYAITVFGLLNLLKNASKMKIRLRRGEISSLIKSSETIFPWLSKNWPKISETFGDSSIEVLLESSLIDVTVRTDEILSMYGFVAKINLRSTDFHAYFTKDLDGGIGIRSILESSYFSADLTDFFTSYFIFNLLNKVPWRFMELSKEEGDEDLLASPDLDRFLARTKRLPSAKVTNYIDAEEERFANNKKWLIAQVKSDSNVYGKFREFVSDLKSKTSLANEIMERNEMLLCHQ